MATSETGSTPVTQTITVDVPSVNVTLTPAEAVGLRTLLYCGVSCRMLSLLGLVDLSVSLQRLGVPHGGTSYDSLFSGVASQSVSQTALDSLKAKTEEFEQRLAAGK